MSRQVLDMLTGFFVARCIAAVAELGIADLLADEGKTVEELARQSSVDPKSLLRILRALQSVGLFAQGEYGEFMLTPLTHCLRSDVEGSLRGMAAFVGHSRTWAAWGQLTECARTSEPAFDIVSGMSLFEYLDSDEEYCALFNNAMRDLAAQSYPAVVCAYDFLDAGTIVDVGGGTGTLLALILKNNNQLRGILFDLPDVLGEADPILKAHRVEDRCTKLAGDFFQSVPAGADTYVLATVIHDWDDEQTLIILGNCRRAIPTSGKLLLVEILVPDTGANYTNVLDLEMLVMTPGGRERTIAEYGELLRVGGFEIKRVIPTASNFYIIEGIPV
jgi:SAM-dependent methyltransferase